MEPTLVALAAELPGLESVRKTIDDRIEYIRAQLAGIVRRKASPAKQAALQKARAVLARNRKKAAASKKTAAAKGTG